jgi:hypothetical protein
MKLILSIHDDGDLEVRNFRPCLSDVVKFVMPFWCKVLKNNGELWNIEFKHAEVL